MYLLLYHILFFNVSNGIEFDKDHLKKYPECGVLPTQSSGRISNSLPSEIQYPWVIRVRRKNSFRNPVATICGGSIITKNTAITSAHCICGVSASYEKESEDIKDKLKCKGKSICFIYLDPSANSLENEITKDNDNKPINTITAGVGSENRNEVLEIEIPFAFIMSDVKDEIDLGVLKTSDDKDNKGANFYPQSDAKWKNKIGPICLSAANSDLTQDEIVMVGWGKQYSEIKSSVHGIRNPKKYLHSCTTNQFGPLEYRFQHCDVSDMKSHQWTCGMEEKQGIKKWPPSYDDKLCSKFEEQAEEAIIQAASNAGLDVLDKWKTEVNQFEIGKKSGMGIYKVENICYRKRMFQERGWCFVKRSGNAWGFCDYSCDQMKEPSDTKPNTYHKITWRIDKKQRSRCIEKEDEHPEWIVCIQSMIPNTLVYQFKVKKQERLTLEGERHEKSEKYSPKPYGTQLPCQGDSGSGHWITDSTKKKAALIGITVSSGKRMSRIKEDATYCGHSSHMLKSNENRILNWIKTASGIIKNPDQARQVLEPQRTSDLK